MTLKERYTQALAWFSEAMPVAETELHFSNPFELLVAVILSAQCTDKRINQVTPELFRAFPTAADMAIAGADEILPYIKSVSYPNNKARALAKMARELTERFGGEIPSDMDSLTSLPGVGRKTANVVLAVVFGQATMAVDTHVFRVSERIGLTQGSKTPLQTERTLLRHIPAELIGKAHHWLILHGRYVCKARSPQCSQCGLTAVCRHYQTTVAKKQSSDSEQK
ncbi:MAG: endonuclease III [Firmicutes bacterium]|nr:endonuclease III [Bacillota bacterium]MCM1400500.1 endonuclease III [Bacteroides sp.]MCM1476872.1 endonuclease III [Bacteroides sp.]